MIHTVGKVVYSCDKIYLQTLNKDQLVDLKILAHFVPENGTLIHLYGMSKNYISKNSYAKRERRNIIDVYFWNDLQYQKKAEDLENLLNVINNFN